MKKLWKSGEPFIWLTASALDIALWMVIGLLALVLWSGAGLFWPKELVRLTLNDGRVVLGQVTEREAIPQFQAPPGAPSLHRLQVKQGNRDLLGSDFVWVNESAIVRRETPPEALVIERTEWGNLHGFIKEVREGGRAVAGGGEEGFRALAGRLARVRGERRIAELRPGIIETLVVETASGADLELSLAKVVRAYRPNLMGFRGRLGFFAGKVWEFMAEDPRESNTEGGVFPAIFGTVLMVLIMSMVVTPLGVLAAFYLREYARQGPVVSAVRIAVNNLAGVPSIVFGVFGVGFFIYFLGGNIDRLFFPEALPTPTFGTGGILWASLTLALLTVPVVIVATEEGLAAIPGGVREASLALGATRFETTSRVVLPAVMPSILTGLILAMARAAGEVAPLMITGVVKYAPSLAVDGSWPFIHLERKFMHLGFHIYDVGFQSPNIDAARPMVYTTTLLLVLIVLALNLTAIFLRNRLRKKYSLAAL